MKNDGALVWVHRIPEVKKIVPYESWLVYIYEPETKLCSFDYKTGKETIISKDAKYFFKIIDGYAYFLGNQNSLQRADLNGTNAEIIEPSDITDVGYMDGYLYYFKAAVIPGGDCEIIKYNCRTGDKEIIYKEQNRGYVFLDGDYLFIDTDKLYRTYKNGSGKTDILDHDYYYVLLISNNSIVYSTSGFKIHIYNYKTKKDEEMCEEGQLQGYDDRNGWYYYTVKNATYRMKDDGSKKEYFCDIPLTAGDYNAELDFLKEDNGLVFIDDWIYYYEDDIFLKKININTKETQKILENNMSPPWWKQV